MIVVIFEVEMRPGRSESYFALAQSLRAELERIDGFISVERFRSLANPEKYVSISNWRGEAAVRAWRAQVDHRRAQDEGKAGIFAGYRIRVAQVLRDYGMDPAAGEAP